MARYFTALCAAALLASAPAPAADPQHPTVVELFESQGCSSCPPALANVNALGDRVDVLPLVFSVTYWDRLGWKDVFAKPAFTQRQWDYAHAGGRAQVATPQTIVDGRAVINGGNRPELLRTIAAARRIGEPAITMRDGKILVAAGRPVGPTMVWLVSYNPRTLQVPIKAGENGGKTLAHRDVVQGLRALGSWTGAAAAYPLPRYRTVARDTRFAILVQQGKGGPIVAAARV